VVGSGVLAPQPSTTGSMSTGAVVPRPASEVTGSGWPVVVSQLDVTDENQLMWS
jgi:hypothetical protein